MSTQSRCRARVLAVGALLAAGTVLAGCVAEDPATSAAPSTPPPTVGAPTEARAPTGDRDTVRRRAPQRRERRRPSWLGSRILPLRPDGYGEVQPTPRSLRDRRLPTVDVLPPPRVRRFSASVAPVPSAVLARSTWSSACPVTRQDLRYVTLTFHGFDGAAHTGELLVNRSVARDVVTVFRTLYRERFPVEEMRVVQAEELDLPPTGDGNNTTAFVCRPTRGSTSWSEHAYGLAIDLNPFHNPYVKGDLVLPELSSAYVDSSRGVPGMVIRDSAPVQAFAEIGWGWGGNWESYKDWMHFSLRGR